MKAFFVASALVSAVLAQDLGTLPTCATTCLAKFTSGGNIGSCSNINAACICADKNFINGIACCLSGACNESDQAAAVAYASKLCSAQGVQVPSAVTCVSSSASSTTAAATGSSTTGASTTTGTAAVNTASTTSTHNAAGALPTPGAELIGGVLAALALL